MRYLFIGPYPPPFVGGSLVYMYNMISNCQYDVDILCGKYSSSNGDIDPLNNVFRSKYICQFNPSLFAVFLSNIYILLWIIINGKNYKGIILNLEVFGNSLIIILCKLLNIPVICIAHGEEIAMCLKQLEWKEKIKGGMMKIAYPFSTGFIVVCHFCRDLLVTGVGVGYEKIDVIPSSINPRKLCNRNVKDYPSYNILSVGRICERKGFHKLVKAIYGLRKEIPDIHLNIVGGGEYLKKVEKIVSDKKINNIITIHGQIKDDDLVALYKDADLFVLAHMMLDNGDTEGCPTVFSEASGCGLPVVGGTGAGANTVIIEGKTGYIVNANDINQLQSRIKKILTNPSLANKLGNAGKIKISKEHNPETVGKAFGDSIQRIAFQRSESSKQRMINSRYRLNESLDFQFLKSINIL